MEIDVESPLTYTTSLLSRSKPSLKYADTCLLLSLTRVTLSYLSNSVESDKISLPLTSKTSPLKPVPPVFSSSNLTNSPTLYPVPPSITFICSIDPLDTAVTKLF